MKLAIEQTGSRRLWTILPILILVVGGLAAFVLMETGPQAERRARPRHARLVEVEVIRKAHEPIVVEAMGTVVPAHRVDVRPQVSGEIMGVSEDFVPGGRFLTGQMLVQIDPIDYALVVRQRKSDVARTKSAYQLEQAQQVVAQREYELLGESIADDERDLVLRKPQLASAQAAYEAAQASLEDAHLDQQRTQVVAPFNGVLQSRLVNVGTQVTPSTVLGTFVGTDAYWVEVSVPVDQLQWLYIPRAKGEKGSEVRIYHEAAWGRDAYRVGHVIRLAPAVEEQGRMARLIVSVDDPLGYDKDDQALPTMLLGTYVRVEITGVNLDDVLAIRRTALRDGDVAWVMNEDDQLDMRAVSVVFRGRDEVLVDGGVRLGERVVTTDLGAPVAGMPLRVNEEADSGTAQEGAMR